MTHNSELSRLMTKLSLSRSKMQRAKESGNLEEAREWLENMAQLKREIANFAAVTPQK